MEKFKELRDQVRLLAPANGSILADHVESLVEELYELSGQLWKQQLSQSRVNKTSLKWANVMGFLMRPYVWRF